jgi:hypothetical protein
LLYLPDVPITKLLDWMNGERPRWWHGLLAAEYEWEFW